MIPQINISGIDWKFNSPAIYTHSKNQFTKSTTMRRTTKAILLLPRHSFQYFLVMEIEFGIDLPISSRFQTNKLYIHLLERRLNQSFSFDCQYSLTQNLLLFLVARMTWVILYGTNGTWGRLLPSFRISAIFYKGYYRLYPMVICAFPKQSLFSHKLL